MQAAILSLLFAAMPDASSGENAVPIAETIIVVCPAEFRPAMQPWIERREPQNRLDFVSNEGSADDIRARIRNVADNAKLRAVVLVGDAPASNNDNDNESAGARSRQTPTFHLPGKVNVHWGGGAEFASDNPYSDLDDDGVPDVAIGRLPADSIEELAVMVRKILAYEDNQDFGLWRSRINFVAGEGGFGAVADSVIESAARKLITWGVPAAYRTTMTQASWQSPYCPDPHRFRDCCLERLNEGCFFWVYIGHGSPRRLKPASFPDGRRPILSCDDCQRLAGGHAPAIALFLACDTGAFDSDADCLAEDLVRASGGPVAVFSGSNVTMPYAMSALGREAMRECLVRRRETVGDLFLHAKRGMCQGDGSPFWSLTHALTFAVAPRSVQPKAERREHLQLFNLFGDPTMRLHVPQIVTLETPGSAAAGQTIHVTGQSPIDGEAEIELVVRRDRFRSEPPKRATYNAGAAGRAAFDATYRSANDPRLASLKLAVHEGRFVADLPVPADASGPCHVRVFVSGADDYALGASDVAVESR